MAKNDDYLFEKNDVFGIYVIDEIVFSNRYDDIQQYLVHDKDTCTCFVLIVGWVRASGGGGWTFSVTPRYNDDGTVMRREDILKERAEKRGKIRQKEEAKKKIREGFDDSNYPSWW